MKILVLSFYYRPDLCAGSFRCTALVDQLKSFSEIDIDVVTTSPNRYASFEESALPYEEEGGVKIYRIALPSHKNGMVDQIKAFYVFYKEAIKLVKNNHYDLIFATSSRLFTAFLGAKIADRKKVPLYLDVRDIFVDTLSDILNPFIFRCLQPMLMYIERYTFNFASHINLVSKGFSSYFHDKFSCPSYSYFTNGIDSEFLISQTISDKVVIKLPDKINILYAGNIGEGQGLHTIIPKLASVLSDKYHITIIGDGGCKALLSTRVDGFSNVTLLDPISRDLIKAYYASADILFLHLNAYSAFEKVLPSKIFEYAATGKPILAGVGGYAREFGLTEITNIGVFLPNDASAALDAIQELNLSFTPRPEFIIKYTRTHIMKKMSHSVIASLSDSKK